MTSNTKKIMFSFFAIAVLWLFNSSPAFASDVINAQGPYTKAIFAVGAMIAAGLSIGLGCIGSGAGIGNATASACEAVGRNPAVQGKVMMTMMIGMALCESICIYSLVIAFILLFANPFKTFIIG
jgi:F-type H+-transporting ATPase subunit c